jgi:hypothetical protein
VVESPPLLQQGVDRLPRGDDQGPALLVQSLARSLRIELLFLPSYSPNLNLIERLWKFVKKECLASRLLPDYETFTQTIDDCLNSLPTQYKEHMTTLLTLNCQTYEDEPVLAA